MSACIALDIKTVRNLTLDTPRRSWWDSACTAKFLGARSSIIHHRNHDRASNRERLWSKIPWFRSALSSGRLEDERRRRLRQWRRYGSEGYTVYIGSFGTNRGNLLILLREEARRGCREPRLRVQTESLDRGIYIHDTLCFAVTNWAKLFFFRLRSLRFHGGGRRTAAKTSWVARLQAAFFLGLKRIKSAIIFRIFSFPLSQLLLSNVFVSVYLFIYLSHIYIKTFSCIWGVYPMWYHDIIYTEKKTTVSKNIW